MTDDELLVVFRQELKNFTNYYTEKMEACKTVNELDKLRKVWSEELSIINKTLFKKD